MPSEQHSEHNIGIHGELKTISGWLDAYFGRYGPLLPIQHAFNQRPLLRLSAKKGEKFLSHETGQKLTRTFTSKNRLFGRPAVTTSVSPSPWPVPWPYGPADGRHRRTRATISTDTPPPTIRRGGPVQIVRQAVHRRRNHPLGDRRRRRREEVGLPDGAEAHPPAYQYPHPLTNPYGDGRSRSAAPAGPSRPSS